MPRSTKVASILDSLSGSEIKQLAAMLAKMGEGGDTILAHITPEEAAMLRRAGGSGEPNPKTGLPAFNDDANSNSEASAQDAAGGNDGTGAGPSGAGASGNSTDAASVGATDGGGDAGFSPENTEEGGPSKSSTEGTDNPGLQDNAQAGAGEAAPVNTAPPPMPQAPEAPRPAALDIPSNGGSDARRTGVRRRATRGRAQPSALIC